VNCETTISFAHKLSKKSLKRGDKRCRRALIFLDSTPKQCPNLARLSPIMPAEYLSKMQTVHMTHLFRSKIGEWDHASAAEITLLTVISRQLMTVSTRGERCVRESAGRFIIKIVSVRISIWCARQADE
jgi:hypothetical protein